MKTIVNIQINENNEEVVTEGEPEYLSNTDITFISIFEKMEKQRSRLLKDKYLKIAEMLLK